MRRIALAVLLLTVPAAVAQPKKDAPAKAVPSAPTLTTPTTLGLTRGKKTEVTLTGTNLKDVSAVSIFGAPTDIPTTVAKGQTDPAKWNVTFDVSNDAPIGMFQLRVASPNGVSNFRPICVDSVPEVADNGNNNKPDKAQKIDWPCVVVGTVANESADYYRFTVKAGQTLNLDCHARRLGSPLDPCLILHDAKTGRELPSLYADDTPGLQSDARFVHTFKADGEYLVQLRDSTYKGGADFGFRFRVSTTSANTLTFPLVVTADVETPITFSPSSKGEVSVKSSSHTIVGTANDAWPVPLRVNPLKQSVEREPNDDVKTATKLDLPAGVSARFEKKGDKDFFSFSAKKGQKIEAVCMTAEIGSPTEVHLRILDDAGKELAVSDPQKPAARAEFTAPADGTYYAATEHLNYLFGPGEVYHLTIKPVVPEFDVAIGTDRIEVPKDGYALMPITGIAKLNGFNSPISISTFGIHGQATIPANANPTKENPLYLPVRVMSDAKGIVPFRVMAKSGEFTKTATAVEVTRAGLGGLTYLPPGWAERFVAVEVPAAPIALGYVGTKEVTVGKSGKIKIEAVRTKHEGEVALTVFGLPANVTAKVKPIAKGEASAEVEIVADAKAVPGTCDVYFKGVAKTDDGERAAYVGPVALTIAAAKKDEAKKEETKKK